MTREPTRPSCRRRSGRTRRDRRSVRFGGRPVQGMLVDLEPFGAFSSQLFFDAVTLGFDGGYRVHAPRAARMTVRYVNFARDRANNMIAGVASVVWQTSFAKADGLRIDAFNSPALQALDASPATGRCARSDRPTRRIPDDLLRRSQAIEWPPCDRTTVDLSNCVPENTAISRSRTWATSASSLHLQAQEPRCSERSRTTTTVAKRTRRRPGSSRLLSSRRSPR